MPALVWHPDALADIERLYGFLAKASQATAQRAALVILEAADLLAKNPNIGSVFGEFRQWPAKFGNSAYVLRYQFQPDQNRVLVVRVWHSRENRTNH